MSSGSASVAPVASSTCRARRLRPPASSQSEPGERLDHAVLDDLHAVAPDLVAGGGEQRGRGRSVAREEPLHVRGGRVARLARVDDHDPAPRAAEHERRAEARGAAADDRYFIRFGVHAPQRGAKAPLREGFVAVSGKRR